LAVVNPKTAITVVSENQKDKSFRISEVDKFGLLLRAFNCLTEMILSNKK
jgi:hypothetical protein